MPEFQWGRGRDPYTLSIHYGVCGSTFLYKMIINALSLTFSAEQARQPSPCPDSNLLRVQKHL